MMIKKIIAKKDEGIAEIIDRVLDEPSKEVLVVVPKGSPLGKSARNFHLLKSETEMAGKKVFVESPDGEIAGFAKGAGIESEPALTLPNFDKQNLGGRGSFRTSSKLGRTRRRRTKRTAKSQRRVRASGRPKKRSN